MHMALIAEDWLKVNTSYCNRLHAWITVKVCEVNSQRTDEYCKGCNGLHDQVQVSATALNKPLQNVLQELLQADELAQHEATEECAPLDEIVDEDTLDEDLVALFPEFKPFLQDPKRLPLKKVDAESSKTVRQIAVYTGFCRRCGGYMVLAPERQFDDRDDEVYRCFVCGWRTSPGYEFNRPNKAAIIRSTRENSK